ncbi:MAG: DUF7453 family protein [Candidatus Anammoxibacter sp.]
MRYKNIALCSLLTILLCQLFTICLYAQSYSIKPIVTIFNEVIPGSKLFVRHINTGGGLAINNNGDSVFSVHLTDFSNAIMLFSNNELKFLVKSKGLSTVPNDEFLEVDYPDINDSGTVVFFGVSFVRNNNFETKIFKLEKDEIISIVGPGDAVNGLETTIASLCCGQSMSINNNGDVAFVANLSDGSYGLFVFTEDEIKPIIIFGDGNKTTVAGNEILGLFGAVSGINDKGEIAFGANLTSGLGVLFFRDGDILPVMIPGTEAPGTNGNEFRGGIANISLSNNSSVVFKEMLITPGGDQDNSSDRQGRGIFLWSEGEIQPLILTGENLPETQGIDLRHGSGFLDKHSTNDFGETVIWLNTTGHDRGLFVVSENDIVPVVFANKGIRQKSANLINASFASINNSGDIIFAGAVDNNIGLRRRFQSGLFMAIKEE